MSKLTSQKKNTASSLCKTPKTQKTKKICVKKNVAIARSLLKHNYVKKKVTCEGKKSKFRALISPVNEENKTLIPVNKKKRKNNRKAVVTNYVLHFYLAVNGQIT